MGSMVCISVSVAFYNCIYMQIFNVYIYICEFSLTNKPNISIAK